MSSRSKRAIVSFLVAGLLFTVLLSHVLFSASGNTQLGACTAALTQMQGAKYAWAHDHAKTTNDVPTDSDLFGPTTYLEHKPTCPAEGTYTIGKVGEPVKCSIPTHKISDPKSRR